MTTTNALNISQPGYVAFDGSGVFTGRTFQAGTGISITNPNGIAGNSTISVTGGMGNITLTGDTGTPIVGNALTVFANQVGTVCGSTVGFSNDGLTTSTLNVTDVGGSRFNTLVGFHAGNSTIAANGGNGLTGFGYGALNAATLGSNCVAVGNIALTAMTTGSANVAVGDQTLNALVSGNNNVAIGHACLSSFLGSNNTGVGSGCLNSTTGASNTAVGYLAGETISTGENNTIMGFIAMVNSVAGSNNAAFGYQALTNCTGSTNCAFGYNAGSAYNTTESGNILINNVGTAAESNVTRIGTSQTTCYVQGIAGVSVANQNLVTINTSTGQLGSVANTILAAPNVALNYYDDFLYSAATADFTAAATRYGEWTAIQSGTTKSITPQITVVAGRPGVMTISVSSTDANCSIAMTNNNNGSIKMATGTNIIITWYFNINTLSTSSQRYRFACGLSSNGIAGSGDATFIEYSDNINSGQWRCDTVLGGSGTNRNSTTTVATGYQVLQIIWTPGVQADFYGGTTLAGLAQLCTPVTTNLPTGQCAPFIGMVKSVGTNPATVDVDLVTWTQTFTSAR